MPAMQGHDRGVSRIVIKRCPADFHRYDFAADRIQTRCSWLPSRSAEAAG